MYLVREVYNARRGKAPEIIEGFQAINSFFASQGNTSGRIFADYAGRMDTIVHQIEVESLDEYYKMERSIYEKPPSEHDPQFQALIDKFNDNSVAGYREILGSAPRVMPPGEVDGKGVPMYVSVPSGAGPFPIVIVIHHGGGVDSRIEERTRILAEAGYFSVAPDLYHRVPPGIIEDGPTRRARLIDSNLIKDITATVDYLQADSRADTERMGILGYCIGGRVAYLMGAVIPEMRAVGMYYGANIMDPAGGGPTPYERIAQIHCPVLGHFGELDHNPTTEVMHKIDAEMTRLKKAHEFYTYPDAKHGFTNYNDPDVYNAEADRTSWPRTLEFFGRHLAGC